MYNRQRQVTPPPPPPPTHTHNTHRARDRHCVTRGQLARQGTYHGCVLVMVGRLYKSLGFWF